MIKLTQEHIEAICHAELALEAYTEKMDSRRVIGKLEQDKLKLTELKLYIIESMTTPELPFAKPDKDVNEQSVPKSR